MIFSFSPVPGMLGSMESESSLSKSYLLYWPSHGGQHVYSHLAENTRVFTRQICCYYLCGSALIYRELRSSFRGADVMLMTRTQG